MNKKNNVIKFNKKKMEILSKTDILIMSLDRKENLIHKNEIIKSLLERKQKPLFLINASIPGNIDMDVNNIDNCFLFDLNDLEQFFSDRVHDIKKKNTTVLEAENDIEYFITKSLMKILIKKIKDVEIMYSFMKLKMLGNLKFKNLPKKYVKKITIKFIFANL